MNRVEPDSETDQAWLGATATALAASPPGQRDPLIAALARYVEALHARYPDGPGQMRKENLDARGNMPRMCKNSGGRAA
jgi:hypothetical protein